MIYNQAVGCVLALVGSNTDSSLATNVVTFKEPSFHLERINFEKMDPEFRRQIGLVAGLILRKHGYEENGLSGKSYWIYPHPFSIY
jgi:hypothetical protein